jgi:hypothetical protein
MNAEIGLQPESRIRIDVRLPGFDLLDLRISAWKSPAVYPQPRDRAQTPF